MFDDDSMIQMYKKAHDSQVLNARYTKLHVSKYFSVGCQFYMPRLVDSIYFDVTTLTLNSRKTCSRCDFLDPYEVY